MTDRLEGFSVAKVQRPLHGECYRVYYLDTYVACISSLGTAFNNRLSFEWHSQRLWTYSVRDFIN